MATPMQRPRHLTETTTRMFAKISTLRLKTDEDGIVAVEFALILPVLLMLYLGLVEFAQGYRVSQKLDLLAHTLADLTAQQLDNGSVLGQAGMDETTIQAIFSSAIPLMAPIDVSTIQMTISEVDVEGTPSNAPTTWNAYVYWTVSQNSGAPRTKCKNANTPLLVLDTAPISSDSMPTSYTQPKTVAVNGVNGTVNPTVGAVIVADVAYNYKPGFSFVPFNWSQKPTFAIKKTSYAPVRNSYTPNHILYKMTSGTNCNAPSL
jgi:Flp pilus assembly protein TadG